MRKKGSKQFKVSRIDRSKALAAQADEAIKERIRRRRRTCTPACARSRSCAGCRRE